MPSMHDCEFALQRMKHPKGSTRDEMLRARAVKLCQDVVRPNYFGALRKKYEPFL